jgi:hypothetical protein
MDLLLEESHNGHGNLIQRYKKAIKNTLVHLTCTYLPAIKSRNFFHMWPTS